MAGENDGPKTYTQEEVDALLKERVDEEVAGLKANRDEALREVKKARDALKKWDGKDPAKYDELVSAAEEAERKRATAEGDFKTLEAKLIEKHGQELEGRDKRIQKALKALEDRAVRAELQAALVKAGAFSTELDLLTDYGMRFGRLKETDDGFEAELVENGARMVADGKGTPMDFDTFAVQVVKQKYPRLFEGTGSSGGGASKSAGGASGSQTTIAAGDNAAFLAHAAEVAKGTVRLR